MEENLISTVVWNDKAESLILNYFLDCAVHLDLSFRPRRAALLPVPPRFAGASPRPAVSLPLLSNGVELRPVTAYVKEAVGSRRA